MSARNHALYAEVERLMREGRRMMEIVRATGYGKNTIATVMFVLRRDDPTLPQAREWTSGMQVAS